MYQLESIINTIIQGNSLDVLRQIPDACIDMAITSPPYFGKRDYTESTEAVWGGYSDCGCGAGFSAGVVLDMFMGSGTTAIVAKELGRRYIGCELNPDYIKIAERRINCIKGTQKTIESWGGSEVQC